MPKGSPSVNLGNCICNKWHWKVDWLGQELWATSICTDYPCLVVNRPKTEALAKLKCMIDFLCLCRIFGKEGLGVLLMQLAGKRGRLRGISERGCVHAHRDINYRSVFCCLDEKWNKLEKRPKDVIRGLPMRPLDRLWSPHDKLQCLNYSFVDMNISLYNKWKDLVVIPTEITIIASIPAAAIGDWHS